MNSSNANYIDELFVRFNQSPESVDPSWRYFFEGLEIGADPKALTVPTTSNQISTPTIPVSAGYETESKVAELIISYRVLGKFLANIDPLSSPPHSHPLLELSRFGLTSNDLTRTFVAGRLLGMNQAKLADIIAHLRTIYCQTVGYEYTHIQNPDEYLWIQEKIEKKSQTIGIDNTTKKLILKRIAESETFERFLHTRYVAQKRFSIEGAESMIPALDCIIETGADLGVQEFVFGMAHRGRLNVLTHIFEKKPEFIFTEFEGTYEIDLNSGEGDVKYHMGFSTDKQTRSKKKVHLSLASNPSHLEFINPVVEGISRAKQAFLKDMDRKKVMPILIHGDAAFAGQGVCYETLNLSQLSGYTTGGTIHIVINNQVGFTTSPEESRSTIYATDLAKMLEVPIFHVNGDDPEALWFISQVCVEYRQKFKKDIFIDLMCYRKHGHNEGDEPSFTQPLLYKKIKTHPSTFDIYRKKLVQENVVSLDEAETLTEELNSGYIQAQSKAKEEAPSPYVSTFKNRWKSLRRPSDEDMFETVVTGVDEKTLKELAAKLHQIPKDFHLHPKLVRFVESRLKAIEHGKGIDWGNAETLAYASLLNEGHPIRLSGQDVGRGTFTHRHSVLHDFETDQTYIPLNHIRNDQPLFEVYNSHLSEMAVLGFEYGYSLSDPESLVIWEAQFGDFANSAQVIIDQFLSSGESKWQRFSGLVLLLPHGFEGQGPEHSSARLERFLQLCGKNNMFVCNLSTPSQIFHALRRQMKRDFRKPLVVMSPKSLLRHPMAVSTLSELSKGHFEEVIDDPFFSQNQEQEPSSVRKVILCSGKLYYDLFAERMQRKIYGVAIVRIEQLYPWPTLKLAQILNQYQNASTFVWAQEEPRNMGAWSYVFNVWSGGFSSFQENVGNRSIQYVGRDFGAAPAVGPHKIHEIEQEDLIKKALS